VRPGQALSVEPMSNAIYGTASAAVSIGNQYIGVLGVMSG
jgi:hypothetical protein